MPCEEMYMDIGGTGGNECACQQELAAVKADMQGRVDTLQSQLDYWQNVTINILKDLYFSPNSGNIRKEHCKRESWSICDHFVHSIKT